MFISRLFIITVLVTLAKGASQDDIIDDGQHRSLHPSSDSSTIKSPGMDEHRTDSLGKVMRNPEDEGETITIEYDPNAEPQCNPSKLMKALFDGDLESFQQLADEIDDSIWKLVFKEDNLHFNSIHAALCADNLPILRDLVARNPPVSVIDAPSDVLDGLNPIGNALVFGRAQVFTQLANHIGRHIWEIPAEMKENYLHIACRRIYRISAFYELMRLEPKIKALATLNAEGLTPLSLLLSITSRKTCPMALIMLYELIKAGSPCFSVPEGSQCLAPFAQVYSHGKSHLPLAYAMIDWCDVEDLRKFDFDNLPSDAFDDNKEAKRALHHYIEVKLNSD